jgi:hypothetical protein
MRRWTDRLTYANVMATIAMFIALGGGAYAALKLPKNSVGTKQLKKDAVTGAKVKNGTLTNQDIDVASLGRVPSAATATSALSADRATSAGNADTVGGQPPDAFAAASRFVSGSASTVPASPQTIVTISGAFRVTTNGLGTDAFFPRYENLSSQTWRFIQPNSGYVTAGPFETTSQEVTGVRTGLILAQNVTDSTKFVLLLCGYAGIERMVHCQAMLPPGV